MGARSGVTLLDLDTKDAGLLDDIQSRYGPSPFKVETGGGYHLYYRYGGERRHIRPWGPDIPVDVLGGGYAIAPPSVAAKGQYEIIHGTLDDLNNLPPLYVMLDELRRPIATGKRNMSIFRIGLEQAVHSDDFESLLDVMRTRNMDCEIPLADSEVEKAARSAWRYEREGRNLVGRGRAVVISHGLLDRLIAANQDAFILLTVLKRHHWGRDFVLSKNMADTLGWLGVDWSSDATTLALKGLPGGVTAAEAFIKVVEEAGSFASYDPVQPSLLRIAPVAAPGSDPVTWPRLVDVQDDTIIARF